MSFTFSATPSVTGGTPFSFGSSVGSTGDGTIEAQQQAKKLSTFGNGTTPSTGANAPSFSFGTTAAPQVTSSFGAPVASTNNSFGMTSGPTTSSQQQPIGTNFSFGPTLSGGTNTNAGTSMTATGTTPGAVSNNLVTPTFGSSGNVGPMQPFSFGATFSTTTPAGQSAMPTSNIKQPSLAGSMAMMTSNPLLSTLNGLPSGSTPTTAAHTSAFSHLLKSSNRQAATVSTITAAPTVTSSSKTPSKTTWQTVLETHLANGMNPLYILEHLQLSYDVKSPYCQFKVKVLLFKAFESSLIVYIL
jgi:hypothetical protein